ncbi:MAG: sensor histidine kinase [bacterium]|jgi:signal transduction histidine kinase
MTVHKHDRASVPAWRAALYALVTLALVAAAAWLAWNTRQTDDGARVEAAGKLQLLNELAARWDLAVARAKTEPAQALQADANIVPSIRRAMSDLHALAATTGSPALAANLPGVDAAIADRIALAASISRTAASLGEALSSAVANSVTRATADAGAGQGALRPPEAAAAELLAFWGDAGVRRRPQVEAALARLPADSAMLEPARAVLDGKSRLESALERFALSTAGPRLGAMTTAFSAEVQATIQRQQLFRTYLLFYSAALLVLLGWIASRLLASYRVIARINDALHAANENLEGKVEQRTRELSDALAHLKDSEAQLIQSEKMSSLGQMVAGVAHEINTPIAYVKNSLGSVDGQLDAIGRMTRECEKLLAMLDTGDTPDAMLDLQLAQLSAAARGLGGSTAVAEMGALVKDGLYGVDQIGQIVTHLRDFSRLDRGKVHRFDIHEGIESTLRLAQHLLKGVRIERRFGTDGHLVGSPSQLNQVLLNLITNAAQAIGPGGGTVTLATGGDERELILEVIDTGAGIPPEVLPRIFDPFFTTKGVGQGTGLGLSICYKIIAQHGGRIDVASRPGLGTTFGIRLPRAGAQSMADDAIAQATPA